jgi:hypothetical protein
VAIGYKPGHDFLAVSGLDQREHLRKNLRFRSSLLYQSTDAGWMISGQPSRVAIGVMTDVAKAYTVQFSDGLANGGLQSLSKSTNGRVQHVQ